MEISYVIIHAGLKMLIAAALAGGYDFHPPTEIIYKSTVYDYSEGEDYEERIETNIMWVNCYKIDEQKHNIYILDKDGGVIEFDGFNWEIIEN